jgi:RNA polymerase sigma factor (sigma-70 family)
MWFGASDGAAATDRGRFAAQRLTAEQEHALLQAVRHDVSAETRQQALSTLWQAHRGLVAAVASRYRRVGLDTADLISAGQLGLHAAIVRFDADRFDGRLSTYAVPWIRWYVQDHVSRNATPVRLPATTAHRQLSRFGARLFADATLACLRERVDPTETELCTRVGRRVGLSADEVARSQRAGGGVSLEAIAGLCHAPLDLGAAPTPEDEAIQRLDREKLRRRILVLADSILGERERAVFLARCMTGEGPICRLEALATRFGVSRERIYQLENSARRKIITALRQEGFATDDVAGQPAQSGSTESGSAQSGSAQSHSAHSHSAQSDSARTGPVQNNDADASTQLAPAARIRSG